MMNINLIQSIRAHRSAPNLRSPPPVYIPPAPTNAISNMDVRHSTVCPNIGCDIRHPHTFTDWSPVPPKPPHIEEIIIHRFDPADHPFPKLNIWEVVDRPQTR